MSGGNDRGGYWRVLLCARCNALCACPSVSFSSGEGVGDRKWQGSRDDKCMSWRGHGGETRRVKVGGGCGPRKEEGVRLEILGSPSTPPSTPPPPPTRNIRAEDNEWQRCNVRPTGKRRERLAGCQMLRCSEARCHTAARSLVPPSIKLLPSRLPLLRYLLTQARRTTTLLTPEADEATDSHTCFAQNGLVVANFPSFAVRLPHDMELYGHSPRLWGCAGAVLTNPGPCYRHDGAKIQKSGMWSPETTSIPGFSVTGSRRRPCADAAWKTPCTLARCLSSGPNFGPACLSPGPAHSLDPEPVKILPRTTGWSLPDAKTRGWRVHDRRP